MNADRVAIVGWDCASPWLVFEHFASAMPHTQALLQRGAGGRLRSCHPPITVPAWMCMATGADAGEHGVYGFRGVADTTDPGFVLTGAQSFRGPRPIWERLASRGLSSHVVGLPGTWPPTSDRIVPGILTPDDHPVPCAGYRYDVADFRNMAPLQLVSEISEMTVARFDQVEDLAARDDWNLLWVVEIGLDRLHHALWHHVDPTHPRFTGDSRLAAALRDYYGLLDNRLGRLVALLDDAETAFCVVSDHGARPMLGGIRVNEYFRERGWLTLHHEPVGIERLDLAAVDWGRTRAWTTGGYCARVYLEDPDPAFHEEVAEALRALPGPDGERLATQVHAARDLWPLRRGRSPDLLAYLGDLDYRCLGTVGAGPIHQPSNDRGPDAANHDWDGIIVAAGPGVVPAALPTSLLGVAGFLEDVLGV